MKKNINICHLTTAHHRNDVRIFKKECISLSKFGYKVFLIVADNLGGEIKDKIEIYDVGKSSGRFNRIFKTSRKIFKQAIELDADIYHLHDPELMAIGVKLKKRGKKVIFDAHEDLPKQILAKPYLNKNIAKVISLLVARYEKYACKKYDSIVTATPYIRDKFLKINKNSIDVNNFPILGEFNSDVAWSKKSNEVCYVGGFSKVRGIKEIVKAIGLTENIKLNLAGFFNAKDIEEEVRALKEWNNVNELGYLNRNGVAELYKKSKAGLVTLHPIVNYLDALPVKMFEYMAAGIPVICSNIKLWEDIIKEEDCGVCVDPFDSNAIALAIEAIIANPERSEQMGKNGRRAALEKYNWSKEEEKLVKLYKNI